jgi:hypothetical protein
LLVEIHEVFGSLNGPLTVMAMRVLSQAKKEKETLTVGQLGIGGELLRSLLMHRIRSHLSTKWEKQAAAALSLCGCCYDY